jgi:hypothetical protein
MERWTHLPRGIRIEASAAAMEPIPSATLRLLGQSLFPAFDIGEFDLA